jgi:uncharacterized membrane protein
MVVAPAALGVAFLHARRALGGARAAGELIALAGYGFALEAVAIHVFGSHSYGRAWLVAPLGVPLAVAVVWAAVIISAMALAARSRGGSATARAAVAALIAVSLDLLMEPVAVRVGLWRWTPPGPWLGVPIGNFVGWAVIVAVYAAGAERYAGDGPAHTEAARRVVLSAASILALVLVGLAWRFLHAEWLFVRGRGWLAWGAILVATSCVVSGRPAVPTGTGLGARLGRASGRGPSAVFLGLAAVFGIDAATLDDPRLWLAALGSTASLLWVSGRASSGSSAPSPAATASPAPPAPGGVAG